MGLDGPEFCYTLVFTVVGTLWSLVFSRCSVYLLNPEFASAVFYNVFLTFEPTFSMMSCLTLEQSFGNGRPLGPLFG